VSLGWNKERTAEQISVRMQIQDEWPDVRGKSIAWFGSFASQESTDITLKTLRTMGWDGKSPLGIPDGKNGCIVGLGGNEVLIVVQHQTYDGETRAKVAFVNPVGGMGFKNPLDGGALSKLNDRVRRHIGATAPRTAGPTHRTVRAEDALPARGTAAARPTPPGAPRQAVSARR
jgi:hypothetical protein